jgi:hypothetical protein
MDDLVQREVINYARAVDRDRRQVIAEWPIHGAQTIADARSDGALFADGGKWLTTVPSSVGNNGLIWIELFGPTHKSARSALIRPPTRRRPITPNYRCLMRPHRPSGLRKSSWSCAVTRCASVSGAVC